MIENENKKGNPYHDEEGKFTSKSGQGQSASTKSRKVGDPLMDLFKGLSDSLKTSQKKEKESFSKIRDMGFSSKKEKENNDVDEETKKWLKLGYSERMYEPELNFSYGYYNEDVEGEPEDIVNYLKEVGADLTEEDVQVIMENNGVMPYRIYEKYFEQDWFEEWLASEKGLINYFDEEF